MSFLRSGTAALLLILIPSLFPLNLEAAPIVPPQNPESEHPDHPVVTQSPEVPPDSTALMHLAKGAMSDVMSSFPTAFTPPPEAQVQQAIATLDDLSLYLPQNDWIVGHRVGLRAMRGEYYEALRVARECAASLWWCGMLEGYMQHLLRDFPGAEAAFEGALAAMPPEARCEWMGDVQLLLSGEMARAYRDAACETKIAMEARIWWLADPLYLIPVNDRKTEHLARTVAMHLHHEALAMVGHDCTDHHAAEVRSGWERWEIAYLMDSPAGSKGYSFFPDGSIGIRPLEATSDHWSLSATFAGERYESPFGPFHELYDRQIASFLRGDSAAVVAAINLAGHPLEGSHPQEGGLILARSELDSPRMVMGEAHDDRYVFRAMAPAERHLVGIEVLTLEDGVARTRFGYAPPIRLNDELVLSDLLLFDWDDTLAEDLEGVTPHMLGTHRIRKSLEIGVYWEVYGLEAGEDVDLSVVVEAREPGLLDRLASVFGFRRRSSSVSLAWEEVVGNEEVDLMGRSLHLGMEHLPAGVYTLEIRVRRPGEEGKTVSRRIELIEE